MPEVVRGSVSSPVAREEEEATTPRISFSRPRISESRRRTSSSWKNREAADVYHDSRAATKKEYRRRATTLRQYYSENPKLLPQLPFSAHHGWRRWRLGLLIFLIFVDACVLPVVLYYSLDMVGHVEGWIIFAVVTTIWGGPTYLEFAIRTLRLIKKERFYRPLGTDYRWCFDLVTWASVVTITAVTALFVVGSAPHIVWIRVLCMPAPALLYSLGSVVGLLTLFNVCGWKAPFRLSSTEKGEPVKPGVYYFIEDIVAVNVGAGRPYREALAARYDASPRFRRMMYIQSIFWSVPPLILAVPLTVVALLHSIPTAIGYGICWVVPFVWAALWAVISAIWVKRDLARERIEWEADDGEVSADPKSVAV